MDERNYEPSEIDLGSVGLSYLQELTEKSKEFGVQIGVPWAKDVYEYLFEQGNAVDLQAILETASGGHIIDLDNE